MDRSDRLILLTLAIGVFSLFIGQGRDSPALFATAQALDAAIAVLLVVGVALEFRASAFKRAYLRKRWFSLGFAAIYAAFFLFSKAALFLGTGSATVEGISLAMRNVLILLRILERFRKFGGFFQRFFERPAQTLVLSFALAILTGSLFLMMPFAVRGSARVSALDALFTATSAVCVTGLAVVDTAGTFSVAGQAVILALIQVGGLGIMIFSYFAVFSIRRMASLSEKMLVSYMLSADDLSGASSALRRMVLTTFGIELAGAAVLLLAFAPGAGWSPHTAFSAVFHSISAFCNAGFSLFPDSLEGFKSDPAVISAIGLLIILGGLGFSTLAELGGLVRPKRGAGAGLSVNSRIVLKASAALLIAGFLAFYLLEHDGAMAGYGLGEQYLSAFFQSVTFRTAGFDTVPFGALRGSTLLLAACMMFIGGATGSTAGGIKVNTIAVLGAYLRSHLRAGRGPEIEGRYSLPLETVGKAVIVLMFGLCAVAAGTFALLVSERAPFQALFFEAVSAFGTVGLSTGLTPTLSVAGKAAIIALMFLGRIGPLTVLAAVKGREKRSSVTYPNAGISI